MSKFEHFLTDRRKVWKPTFRIFHVGYTNICAVILQGIYMSCEKCNRSMFDKNFRLLTYCSSCNLNRFLVFNRFPEVLPVRLGI